MLFRPIDDQIQELFAVGLRNQVPVLTTKAEIKVPLLKFRFEHVKHRQPLLDRSIESFCRSNAILVARKANNFNVVAGLQPMFLEERFGLAMGGTQRFMAPRDIRCNSSNGLKFDDQSLVSQHCVLADTLFRPKIIDRSNDNVAVLETAFSEFDSACLDWLCDSYSFERSRKLRLCICMNCLRLRTGTGQTSQSCSQQTIRSQPCAS